MSSSHSGPTCSPVGVNTSRNAISLLVMVPVLSTQSMSTRASVSMLRMSCNMTMFWASRMALRASAMVTSRYSPSGIIPMTAPTMDVTASC